MEPVYQITNWFCITCSSMRSSSSFLDAESNINSFWTEVWDSTIAFIRTNVPVPEHCAASPYAVLMQSYKINHILVASIQIKITMSKDILRILVKILAESYTAFDSEIQSTFDSTQTDRPALFSTFFKACCMRMLANRAGLSVCVLSNVDFSY